MNYLMLLISLVTVGIEPSFPKDFPYGKWSETDACLEGENIEITKKQIIQTEQTCDIIKVVPTSFNKWSIQSDCDGRPETFKFSVIDGKLIYHSAYHDDYVLPFSCKNK